MNYHGVETSGKYVIVFILFSVNFTKRRVSVLHLHKYENVWVEYIKATVIILHFLCYLMICFLPEKDFKSCIIVYLEQFSNVRIVYGCFFLYFPNIVGW